MIMRTGLIVLCGIAVCPCAARAQFPQAKPVITSVEPLSGSEGTIVTIKGRNFPINPKNSCIVLGGMGAMASVEPNSTSTELKVKIGPVAKKSTGDLLMWPGTALDVHTADLSVRDEALTFRKVKLFRNGAPVTSAGVKFELTDASSDTYAGYFEEKPSTRVELGGLEDGPVVRVAFPRDLKLPNDTTVDVVFMLKEPTLAIGFSGQISGKLDSEGVLRVIAKGIAANATFIGEKVFADVARNDKTGELELYVTKPYLESGKGVIRFMSKSARTGALSW